MMNNWKDKKVAVVGLGVEGLSCARFLTSRGAEVWVFDAKNKEELDPNVLAEVEQLGCHIMLGEKYLQDLSGFAVIVRSPGVQLATSALIGASQSGAIVTSQTKLFFDLCPCPIIGVTGTKGKGTTATLIYEMLKAAGKEAYLGGNIGIAPLDFLGELTSESWVVLELSSFQLQDVEKSPHIAVMLMVTSDHLDYHPTIEEYVDAKRNILRFQTPDDFAIVNRDYPASSESDIHTDGQVFYVSRERETDNACFAIGNKVIVRRNGNDEEIIQTADILLPGKHNLENVCAAVMAAKLAGVGTKHIVQVLKTFKGLEHRLEYVGEKYGINFCNDSLSTIPEAAIAAIEAFDNKVETLIAGGYDRGLDYTELGRYLATSSVKNLILFSPSGERIWQAVVANQGETHIKKYDVASMHQAVVIASEETSSGNICLLSPASASFGLFKNYKDRGEQFKREVEQL